LVDGIARLVEDSDLRVRLSAQGRLFAREHLDIAKNIGQIEAIIVKVARC
jgi:hypothetical protein